MFRTVFNGAALVAKMRESQAALENPEPMHQEMGEYLVEAHRQRFQRGEAPDGTPWAPKKPPRNKRWPRPLIGESKRLSTEIVMFANRAEVEVGSNLEYSGVMNRGAKKGAFGSDKHGRPIPWGDIPARVWLGLSDDDELELIDIVDGYLADALTG